MYKYEALARYNSEVARGIVHTPEWKEKMAKEQEQFDKEQREAYASDPNCVVYGSRNG